MFPEDAELNPGGFQPGGQTPYSGRPGGHRPSPPSCIKCAHYRVSWDPVRPHACNVFEIKTRLMPAVEVYNNAGGNCPAFHPKAANQRNQAN